MKLKQIIILTLHFYMYPNTIIEIIKFIYIWRCMYFVHDYFSTFITCLMNMVVPDNFLPV